MAASRAAQQLNVIGLGRPTERPREAELLERRLRDALDAGRVGRLAARVRIVGESANLDRVLGRAVARDPDQVQPERLAEAIEPRGDDRLDADAVVGPRRREEAGAAAV